MTNIRTRSLRWDLVRRLVALQAVMLTLFVVLVIGALWSGGDYGPEASILTSAVLFALFVFLWKAPVRQQRNALLDQPVET